MSIDLSYVHYDMSCYFDSDISDLIDIQYLSIL